MGNIGKTDSGVWGGNMRRSKMGGSEETAERDGEKNNKVEREHEQ